MLYELFSWLTNDDEIFPISPQIITRSDLDKERELSLEKRRKLLGKLYEARFNKSQEIKSDQGVLVAQLERQDAYLCFLDFSNKIIHENQGFYSLIIGIEFLFSRDFNELNESKIMKLFEIFFADNRAEFLDYYQNNKERFGDLKEVNLMVIYDSVERHLLVINHSLSSQENPLSIAPMFGVFIDSPERFCASLLWLLRRGISAEQILQTNLLQNFMSYHLVSLHALDSPIFNLYALLKRFPEGKMLISIAEHIRCRERGFESYALTGHRSLGQLQEVIPVPGIIGFSSSSENFISLYTLFGQAFLIPALEWYMEEEDKIWLSTLVLAVNQLVSADDLLILINQIAKKSADENNPKLLEVLASILQDSTLDTLIISRPGAILHLLPYKPDLCKKINTLDMGEYIKKIDETGSSDFDVVLQLMAVFTMFRVINNAIATQVFEAIISRMLSHPILFEDDSLFNRLKKFKEKEIVYAKIHSELVDVFLISLQKNISEESFVTRNYHLIEDAWFSVRDRIFTLNDISSFSGNFPADKYEMQAYVAHAIFAKNKENFNLNNFVKSLEIEPIISSLEINGYERLLIEILTTIDDEAIRQEVIGILEEKYSHEEWIHKKYGGETVLNRAAKKGNIGFLTWLDTNSKPNRALVMTAAFHAAKTNQWLVVDYFCHNAANKPQQQVIEEILIMAAREGELRSVQYLCDFKINHPRQKAIELAFQDAIANGHVSVVQFFCTLSTRGLCDTMIVKGFKAALHAERLEVVRCIGNLCANRILQSEVERSLSQAAEKGNLPLIQVLCGFELNPISPNAIDSALIIAAKKGFLSIVQYLTTLTSNPRAIEQALQEAVRANKVEIVIHLCRLPLLAPRQKAIEQAMLTAAKLGYLDINQYLISLSVDAPRPPILAQALLLAVNMKQTHVVNYLSNSVRNGLSQRTIEEVFLTAVKVGYLPTVRCLYNCQAYPPRHKVIQMAIRNALKLEHQEIYDFLRRPASSYKSDEVESLPASPKSMPSLIMASAVNPFRMFTEHKQRLRRVASSYELGSSAAM